MSTQSSSPVRLPVYFLSIGGPNFIENTAHPAYTALSRIGHEITTSIKPKAVLVFSAHWQSSPQTISINTAEQTDLIYDFYGFPKHYYEVEYPNRGSREVAERVIETLTMKGVQVDRVTRGLDHGVWVGFMAAFDPQNNPLGVPIVQASLYGTENAAQHYALGEALLSLREQGMLIIGAGMAVHNLHDFRKTRGAGPTQPYTISFDAALKDAVTAPPAERQERLSKLLTRSDARKAHPSLEHLLPVYVCAGAAGEDVGEQVWTFPEGSLSWAQFRFGSIGK